MQVLEKAMSCMDRVQESKEALSRQILAGLVGLSVTLGTLFANWITERYWSDFYPADDDVFTNITTNFG